MARASPANGHTEPMLLIAHTIVPTAAVRHGSFVLERTAGEDGLVNITNVPHSPGDFRHHRFPVCLKT